MINLERDILKVQESLLKLGMDISILELDNENYSAIFKADNRDSKEIGSTLCLEKNLRLNGQSSPVIILVRIGKKE